MDIRGDYNRINVIQELDGHLIRITTPADAFRIISVGPIRAAKSPTGSRPATLSRCHR